jgi:mannose-6-phosphate isomerase-like protein (cupin superfamily)
VGLQEPAALAALVEQLRTDSPIAVLEGAERQLKSILHREMAAPPDGAAMRELASLQQQLGFLLKYKSYAVKAASPLGYSVFLQQPGEGFSFQQHVVHKTEMFYFLDVLPGGFVFLCDFAEWQRIYDRDAFLAWLDGKPDARYERWRFVPQPGDVIVIDRLNVVHSVIGCTLAEFATVSTDMVDRLHDQNEKRPVPAEFTRKLTEGRLRGLAWPDTAHRVTTGTGGTAGYSRRVIPPERVTGGVRTALDEGVVSASTYRFDAGAASGVSVDPVRATSLHVVHGSGRLVLGEASEVARPSPPTLEARAGDLFFVAPGAYYRFINDDGEPLTVAEHRIPADVAFV